MSELLEQMKLLNEDHKPDGWPAVRMSEINELIEIIEKKSEQLAKANERVKELELIVVAITHADETGYVDDVGFVENWSQVCDETKALLNKFAIEKQLETAKKCAFGSTSWVLEHIKFLEEQLRKEQE
ncbi:MAG: hypothetical protein CMK89_21405 [Pseudomonadales bacterium]|nr:hypothetical protein [Pseudomonadales bacterium]